MFRYEPGSLYFNVVSPLVFIHHSMKKVLPTKREIGLKNMNSENNAFGKMFNKHINIKFNVRLIQEALR